MIITVTFAETSNFIDLDFTENANQMDVEFEDMTYVEGRDGNITTLGATAPENPSQGDIWYDIG